MTTKKTREWEICVYLGGTVLLKTTSFTSELEVEQAYRHLVANFPEQESYRVEVFEHNYESHNCTFDIIHSAK